MSSYLLVTCLRMCYDISFTVDIKQLSDYFPDLIFDDQLEIAFGAIDHIQGVSVFAKHPIIYINRDDGKSHCKLMEWGCIPYYTTEEPHWKVRNGMLNIRAERILDDPKSYWHKIRNRRCLIPVTGIFEHREIPGWKKKVPYIVRPINHAVFFLPGLYSVAEIPDEKTGEIVKRFSYGLITRAANSLMKKIHNSGENSERMPLFLSMDQAHAFLADDLSEETYRAILNFEMPSSELEYDTVCTIRTSKLRTDEKQKHEHWSWEQLPPLSI